MFRVMHSMHSSYTELCDFISYLSPHSIVPCVIPFSLGDTSITDLHSRLKESKLFEYFIVLTSFN